jgi:Na+-translocating ferredoxin:NAD+ oxidoreductase RnfD subunit
VRRFFRTPKGLLTIVLAILTALAAPHEGVALVLPGLAAAIAAAMVVDAPLLRWRTGRWEFPSGAMLTGWIVALVLSPHEAWWLATVTSVLGVLSKYAFRYRTANIFNPAALAMVVTFYIFDTGTSWWGALPEISPWALIALLATGVFITMRVNKMPMALAFLGMYFALFTTMAYVTDPSRVTEIFIAPDLHAALFFAFIILTDPPTSPTKYADQIICSVIVAVISWIVFEGLGAAHFLLAGVLAGNLWEWARRARVQRARV